MQSEYIYSLFSFSGIAKESFYYFVTPDLLCISLLSAIVAYKPSEKMQFIILGAFLYATLFCLHASIAGEEGYLSTILMLLGSMFNILLCFGQSIFRESTTNNVFLNLFKSFIQTIFFWTVSLVLIPFIIIKVTKTEFSFNLTHWNILFGSILFIIYSSLGIWSGYLFATKGHGTPLPVDSTKKLVLSGPYAYVRNPMAISGLGQGFSVSLIAYSLPIFIYVLLGLIIWNYSVRRIEEADLLEKFGNQYSNYLSNVKCWFPRITPYSTNT